MGVCAKLASHGDSLRHSARPSCVTSNGNVSRATARSISQKQHTSHTELIAKTQAMRALLILQ